MAATPFSMSGLFSLDAQQTEFLEALGLEVPPITTREQLQVLVSRAQHVAESMSNDMIRGMTESTLADLKACFGLT